MDRNRFVLLAIAAFGLLLASFLIRGTTRILLPYRVSLILAAPVVFAAFAIIVYLFVWGLLDLFGVRSIE